MPGGTIHTSALRIEGRVQGVGFRPFLSRLARKLELAGEVHNLGTHVRLRIVGPKEKIGEFISEIERCPPPLARIERLTWDPPRPALEGERSSRFEIVESAAALDPLPQVCPDLGTCVACREELFDPSNRRYRYPFISCTACGPRASIVERVPFDRQRTSLRDFGLCRRCTEEYRTNTDRRYHAQTIGCHECGPKLRVQSPIGTPLSSSDPVKWAAERLRQGQIGAVKGLGGFHLVCDAHDESAVQQLRERKHRPTRPFAVMAKSLEAAARFGEINEAARQLLTSAEAPIVLLERTSSGPLAPNVAPRCSAVGVMLPYTPLHHLLAANFPGDALVMTSANRSGGALLYRDDDLSELASIADFALTHDRPIVSPSDDSVWSAAGDRVRVLRYGRGLSPATHNLPFRCPVTSLAFGGDLKAAFLLASGERAMLGPYVGDLSDHRVAERYRTLLEHSLGILEGKPQYLMADRHPDFISTRLAQELAEEWHAPLHLVQHHEAHVASCVTEHRIEGDVIGIAFDGFGLGDDGAAWGGEFFVGSPARFERAAHFRCVPLPGGDRAVLEPWRMAWSHLFDAGLELANLQGTERDRRVLRQMVEKKLASPLTSSVGRLFDAVSALLGLCTHVSYDAEAAIKLEALASQASDRSTVGPFAFALAGEGPLLVDTRPMFQEIAACLSRGEDRAVLALRFHSTLAEIVISVCQKLRTTTRLSRVALSGGVFANARLTTLARERLEDAGFEVYTQDQIPCNDGGLALGQLAIGIARS